MKQKILVVEDDKKISAIVKAYLEASDFFVIQSENCAGAVNVFEKEKIDLVILDLMLPDGTGESLIQEIKAMQNVPVIMISAKSSEEERLAGFSLGADDYVVKPFSPRELVARAKVILKRAAAKEDALSFNNGEITIDRKNLELKKKGKKLLLTQTEFKLIDVLVSNNNNLCTRLELVEKALGYQFEGYERSVDAHIKNLRHKLNDDPKKPKYIETVFGSGYRFIGKKDVV